MFTRPRLLAAPKREIFLVKIALYSCLCIGERRGRRTISRLGGRERDTSSFFLRSIKGEKRELSSDRTSLLSSWLGLGVAPTSKHE